MKNLLMLLALTGVLLTGCGKKTGSGAASPASLAELNRALSSVMMMHPRFPPATNEIEKFLTLEGKSMPTPPPGKNLVLNPETRQYEWADQTGKN